MGGIDAPVVSITDEDILSSEEQTFTPFFGLADTVNGVSGKFPDPAQVWQLESAPPLHNPDFEIEDGGRRLMVDVQYDLAPYSEQVQRLMQGGLNEARRARRHTFVLPPRFWSLEAGDIVSFTSERNGYVAKLFRVDGVLDQSNADVLVDLTEVDPADYVFDTNTDYTPVTGGSVTAPVVSAQVIAGWSVTAAASTDAQGAGRFPAIAVGWDGDMDDVIAVEVRVRVKATGAMIFSGRFEDVAAAVGLIVAGILPAETYEAQGRYVPGTSRETVWSDWLEVTTLDLRITRDQLHDEIGASLDQAEQDLLQLSQDLGAARQAAADAVGGLFATGFFGDIWSFWSLNGSKLPGSFYPSGNLYEFTVSDVQNAGLQLWSDQAGWVGAAGADRYLLELEFELVSGATSGAGVLFDWRNTNNQLFRVAVPLSDFVSEPIVAGQRYFGSVLVERPADFAGTFARHSLYLMANYGELGTRSAKTIRFHKFQGYPATITDARTAQHAGAITDLQGNSAAAITFRVKAGGAEGDLELVAFDNINGAGTALLANIDQFALRGSISSDKLTVGLPTVNLLPDPLFEMGDYHLLKAGTGLSNTHGTVSLRGAPTDSWRPAFGPSLQLSLNSAAMGAGDGSYFEARFLKRSADGATLDRISVEPEGLYEFSMQIASHRARAFLYLIWYGADGSYLGYSYCGSHNPGNAITPGALGDLTGSLDWPRVGDIVQAPSGAVEVVPLLRFTQGYGVGWDYIFAHSPMLRPAGSLDEAFAPFSHKGQAVIDGGSIISDSVTSKQVDAVEFRSAGLAIFGGAVMSANFDGTVDAAGNLLARGTQGFAITQQGQAVLTNLIARDDIQVGAVSNGVTYASDAVQKLYINDELFRYSLGAFAPGEFWQIACAATWRGLGSVPEQDNEGDWHTRTYDTGIRLQWRRRTGTTWTGWDTIHTFSKTTSSSWRSGDVVVPKLGTFDEVEVRAVIYGDLGARFPSGSSQDNTRTNVSGISLHARAIVR